MGGYEEMMTSSLRLVYETMTSDDKVVGWVKKGKNHDDVILEWSLMYESKAATLERLCSHWVST